VELLLLRSNERYLYTKAQAEAGAEARWLEAAINP
jgi:hypothetical protein